MSVYKPQKGRYWHYDFQHKGRRYYGSTGATTRSKAERVEATNRVLAAQGKLDRPARPVPTLDEAATTWWRSKQHLRTADELLDRVTRAVRLVGAAKPVNEVTFADVQTAIQRWRGLLTPGKAPRPPAPGTVNRDMVSTLRPVLRLARELLNDGSAEAVPFPEIPWSKLRLAEPKPRARDFKADDVRRFLEAVPAHLRDFARFQARYGCRLGEMFFTLADIDLETGRVRLRDRKGGDDHTIPITADDAALLATRVGRARAAGLDTVWFREEGKALVAVTYWHAQKRLGTAMTAAGLRAAQGARGSHDLRHHAGMQMLRSSGNLRTTQRLLGHASITSTLVYAHALEDDLRSALDKLSRPAPEPVSSSEVETDHKPRRSKGP